MSARGSVGGDHVGPCPAANGLHVDVEQPRDLCGRQKLFTVGRYAAARSSRRAMCLINAETNDSPAPLLGAGVRAVVEETSELAMDVAHFEMDVSAAVPYG